jgi:hypothetical protein
MSMSIRNGDTHVHVTWSRTGHCQVDSQVSVTNAIWRYTRKDSILHKL